MSEIKDLPSGWVVSKLKEVCDFYSGVGFPTELQGRSTGKYPFYKVGDISKNVQLGVVFLEFCENFIEDEELSKLKAKLIPEHTVVFAKIGEALKLNRRAITRTQCLVDNNAIGIRAKECFVKRLWIFYFLKTIKLENYSRATTVPSVRKSDIEEIEIPLPPITEQHRIVAKIEELFRELDKGVESLKTAQQQLKVYRQAVLKWAFEGKLTGIRIKEKKSIESMAYVGTGATPLRSNSSYYNGNIPWITSSALNELYVNKSDEFITEKAIQETNVKVFPKHTLLMAMYGEGKTRGKCSELLIEAATNQAIAGIVIKDENAILRQYLKWFLVKNYNDIRKESSGGVQPNLNLKKVKDILFPFCSLEEQAQIVQEIESRLSVCDKMEEAIENSLAQAEALRQSILKKAFEGKLVPQDPNDEPAEKLLEKIRLENQNSTPKPTKKKAKGAVK